jgi:hypothetical protein
MSLLECKVHFVLNVNTILSKFTLLTEPIQLEYCDIYRLFVCYVYKMTIDIRRVKGIIIFTLFCSIWRGVLGQAKGQKAQEFKAGGMSKPKSGYSKGCLVRRIRFLRSRRSRPSQIRNGQESESRRKTYKRNSNAIWILQAFFLSSAGKDGRRRHSSSGSQKTRPSSLSQARRKSNKFSGRIVVKKCKDLNVAIGGSGSRTLRSSSASEKYRAQLAKAEKKTALADQKISEPNLFGDHTKAYEELRNQALLLSGRQNHSGLVVIVRDGVGSWLKQLTPRANIHKELKSDCALRTICTDTNHSAIVCQIASMVLAKAAEGAVL